MASQATADHSHNLCSQEGEATALTRWAGFTLTALHTHLLFAAGVVHVVNSLVVARLLGAARHARLVLIACGTLQGCR